MKNLDNETFICAVEERPVIRDRISGVFKDRNKTKAAWENMCNIFIDNYQELAEKEKAERGGVTIMKVNNQSALKLANTPEIHKRTKHIDIKYHFLRESSENGIIKIDHVEYYLQLADILTDL
ncbi:hypothetical protein JTB14_032880 [Gonioctena quinquepunctata]|nr:hypothetical protein JTB14_032880 [Gonioctena quinquepunctata]